MTLRKLRLLVLVLALGTIAGAARAQVGIYFNPVVTRISNSKADTGPFAFLGDGQKSQIFGGVVFGAYYDISRGPHYNIGVDMRDAIEHGNNASINSFLLGVRLTGRVQERLRPYVELAVGDGRTRSPVSPAHINKLEADAFVGADYRLGRHVDFRIAEIGYGTVQTVSTATYNPSVTYPNARLLNFSSGFVFRFGGGGRTGR